MNNKQEQQDKSARDFIDEEHRGAHEIMVKFCLTLLGFLVLTLLYAIKYVL
jgi:hypothetical protein